MSRKGKTTFGNILGADNKQALYLIPILLIISFFVYKNLLNAEFLDYDDGGNVVENIAIKEVSVQNIKTIFTSATFYSYSPLTFLMYMMEWQLFGNNSSSFHLISILLHLINVLLVYSLATLLTKNKIAGMITATLFALHPIHVDTVGWISAQSYLLATMFYLLALIYYIRYIQTTTKRPSALILSLLFFVLACLSKSQAFTLAPIILAINWLYKKKYDVKQILIVSLFFLISIGTGLLTIYFRSDIGKTEIIPDYTYIDRLFVICSSIVSYIFKIIYPVGLMAIEPYPWKSAGGSLPLLIYFSPIVLMTIVILLFINLKKAPLLVFGFLFFFLNIVVTQFSFLEDGYSANRYFYLSSAGIYIPLSIAIVWIYNKLNKYKYWLFACGFIIIFLLSGIANTRTNHWQNTFRLTSSIIEHEPETAMAYNIRGIWYFKNQQYTRSINDFDKAITLFPNYSSGYYNKGLSQAAMQDHVSALENYKRAIELNPNFGSAYQARGVFYLSVTNDYTLAINDFNKAISLDPTDARAYFNRGLAYFRMRNVEEACKNWYAVKNLGYSQANDMINKYCR